MEIGTVMIMTSNYTTVEEQIGALKEAGINRTFLSASHPKLGATIKLVQESGMICETLHGAFSEPDGLTMEDFHKPGMKGEKMLERLCDNILTCKKYNVPVLIVHIPADEPEIVCNECSEKRYKQLGDLAREYKITLAFENTGMYYENFEYILKLIPEAKFCWDNAHEKLFGQGVKMLSHFGHKLVALHITDNNCEEDDHMIPFEGKIDFDDVAREIAETGFAGTLMFEVSYNKGDYAQRMSYGQYALQIKAAADRLLKMIEIYRKRKVEV